MSNTYTTPNNPSVAQIQALHDGASNGDTIVIPDGSSMTWSSQLNITKAITLKANTVRQMVTPQPARPTVSPTVVTSPPTVNITHGGGSQYLIWLTNSSAGNVSLQGINFHAGSSTNTQSYIGGNDSGGLPMLIKGCVFNQPEGQMFNGINWFIGNGVFTNCYWNGGSAGCGSGVFVIKGGISWYAASTFGALDINGLNHVYIEQCQFDNCYNQAVDADDKARVVIRRCIINNTQFLTHGITSDWGGRQVEIYENTFQYFYNGSGGPFSGTCPNPPTNWVNLNRYMWWRAGSGRVWGNSVQPIYSGGYYGGSGGRASWTMIQEPLGRSGSGNGGVIETYPGDYIGTRWPGSGSNATNNRPTSQVSGVKVAQSFSDPLYIWNNVDAAGTPGSPFTGSTYWSPSDGTGMTTTTTFQLNRDIFLSAPNNNPSPPYTAYQTYPHQIDGGGSGSSSINPAQGHPFSSSSSSSYTVRLTSPPSYYVSNSLGSDANNGTSVGAPWKNCPGMTLASGISGSTTLAPGSVVNFLSTDTWVVPAGTQGLLITGGVSYIGNSWGGSSTRAIIRAGGVQSANTINFRDHATIPTSFIGFEVDTNHQVNDGIGMNHPFYAGTLTGALKTIDNCLVHDNWSDASIPTYTYGIIVSNHGGNAGLVSNVLIQNTKCYNTSRDALCLYSGDENAQCLISNITVRNCEAYNSGQDPNYVGAGSGFLVKSIITNAFLEYNYAHNTKGAPIFISSNETNHYAGVGLSNIHVRYNVATTENGNGGIRLYSQGSGSDPKDIKIYGNIVYNQTTLAGLMIGSDNANTLNLLIYNNTFYNAPVVIQNLPSATVQTFEFKNNICYSIGNGIPLTDTGAKILSHSNNTFVAPSGNLVSSGGTGYTSSNLTTYEASALSTNPLFTNTGNLPTVFSGTYGSNLAPANNGLSVQTGSPVIGSGVVLSSPYDNSINSVSRGALFDRGAYEYPAVIRPSPHSLSSSSSIISPRGTAPSFVQACWGENGSSSSKSATFSNKTQQLNDCILVFAWTTSGSGAVINVPTDTSNNTYSAVGVPIIDNAGAWQIAVFVATGIKAALAGANTVTFNITNPTNPLTTWGEIIALEYQSVDAVNPIDPVGGNQYSTNQGADSGSGTQTGSSTITTTINNDTIVSWIGLIFFNLGGQPATTPAGYTLENNANTYPTGSSWTADFQTTNPGSFTPAWTFNHNVWTVINVALKAGSQSVVPPPLEVFQPSISSSADSVSVKRVIRALIGWH